jgi:ATP/maltotriose-dependent transcriptional regulator MalT
MNGSRLGGSRLGARGGLFERYYKETIWRGEFARARRWLDALPESVVRSSPFLCLIYAALLLDQPVERAEAWLQAAEEAWEEQPYPAPGLAGPPSTFDREAFVANLLDIRTVLANTAGASSEEAIALTQHALERTPDRLPSLRAAMFQRLGWCSLDLSLY